MRTQCIKHVRTSASKLGQCSVMLLMNKFTISFKRSEIDESGTSRKPVSSLVYLKQLILFVWHYLHNDNSQPNYKVLPHCFKGFCQPKPLSHFTNWIHLLWDFHTNMSWKCLTGIWNWIYKESSWWQLFYNMIVEGFCCKCYTAGPSTSLV